MQTNQAAAQAHGALVEERFFNIRLGETGGLLKQAIEEASGFELEELAPGMWIGKRELSRWSYLQLTARAQAVEDGTTVELRVEHKSTPGAVGLYILAIIVLCSLILPIVPMVMWTQKVQERQRRARLVLMHKLWTELSEVVGAPRRTTGYRQAPERAYAPAPQQAAEPRPRVEEAGPRIAEAAAGPRVATAATAETEEDEVAALELEHDRAERDALERAQARR